MIDLDELERLCREAEAARPTGVATDRYIDESGEARSRYIDALHRLNEALRNAAPELIAMARRLEWIADKAIDWDEVEHKAFLIELPVLRGPNVYAAIDAAMQEQEQKR